MNVSPRMQKVMDRRGWTIEERLFACTNKNHPPAFFVTHAQEQADRMHRDEPTHTSACSVRLVKQHR